MNIRDFWAVEAAVFHVLVRQCHAPAAPQERPEIAEQRRQDGVEPLPQPAVLQGIALGEAQRGRRRLPGGRAGSGPVRQGRSTGRGDARGGVCVHGACRLQPARTSRNQRAATAPIAVRTKSSSGLAPGSTTRGRPGHRGGSPGGGGSTPPGRPTSPGGCRSRRWRPGSWEGASHLPDVVGIHLVVPGADQERRHGIFGRSFQRSQSLKVPVTTNSLGPCIVP